MNGDVILQSKEETKAWIEALARGLHRPAVVLLSGDLGAGKTQCARWLIASLGAPGANSPTFAIHHAYPAPAGAIDHLDLYRLKNDADLEATGFFDLLVQPRALVVVEWADRLPPEVWPTSWTRHEVRLERLEGDARRVDHRVRPADVPK